MSKYRNLYRIVPFQGVDYSKLKLGYSLNDNGDAIYSIYEHDVDCNVPVFSVHEDDVDFYIELGILREETEQYNKWTDQDMIDFAIKIKMHLENKSLNAKSTTVADELELLKKSKGLIK